MNNIPLSSSSEQNLTALTEVVSSWKVAVLDKSFPPVKTNEELRLNVRTYFRNISSNGTGSRVMLQTRSSHEEALARLIRDLEPAFTSSHPQRFRVLNVFLGAIEGCKDVEISNATFKLIGEFLLLQCGPLIDDEYEEDYDNMIRDVCVEALTALSEMSAMGASCDEYAEALKQKVHVSVQGVQRRCASPEGMEREVQDAYVDIPTKEIRDGLSILPRSRRSLCFKLLRGAVAGISKINVQIDASGLCFVRDKELLSDIQGCLIDFTEFSTRCMTGESDPRCLMQLLELLHSIQTAFESWFDIVETVANVFPHEDVFHSVAPYYPIQFTPPSNNIHGITREGLHSELVSVLTFTEMDGCARKHRKPTMLGCSIGLFLDQLLPEESPPTSLEKLETLECVSSLLFHDDISARSECGNLTLSEVRSLSEALQSTHDEASTGVGGDKITTEENMLLAKTCRVLVSRVARDLETLSKDSKLWDAFVLEPLNKAAKRIQHFPFTSKTTIAYVASLCASGGPKTLRMCLANGLFPLLCFLENDYEKSEDALAAIHGVAAFLSSTNIALLKIQMEGVELSPHPLEPYANQSCNLLLAIIEMEDSSASVSLTTAAIKALECLFISYPQKEFHSEEMVQRICNFIHGLLRTVIRAAAYENEEAQANFLQTSSRVLGRCIGVSMASKAKKYSGEDEICSILSSTNVYDFVQSKVFCQLKESVFGVSADLNRYDRQAMATACSTNFELALLIVRDHLSACLEALQKDFDAESTFATFEALSFLCQNSDGDNVVRAFHENGAAEEILDNLTNKLTTRVTERLRDSIAQIALPATKEENENLLSRANWVRRIEESLIPAYQTLVPEETLAKLLREVSAKVPPLSVSDEAVLFVRLPILAAALQATSSASLERTLSEVDRNDDSLDILEGLTEYALSRDHLFNARSSAGSCIHHLLRSGYETRCDCPVKPLVIYVSNMLSSSIGDVALIQTCLDFLSLLGQAGAIRGSSSSSTTNEIARFLVGMACEQDAAIPYHSQGQKLDTSTSLKQFQQTMLKITAASGYGSMLVVDGVKPLIKQRLSHACLTYIKHTYDMENNQAQHVVPILAPSIGQLLVVCHLICATDLSKLDRNNLHMIAKISVEGFSSGLFEVGKTASDDLALARVLVVCAVLKLICTAAQTVNGFVLTMVTGLLRAYAVADSETEVGCKMVVLQALEELSKLDGAKSTIIAVKPAVLAILASAMNQRIGLLRSAAVDVRNAWCLVD